MFKNKKMSRGNVLILALSLLLVVSLSFSLTRAWFQGVETEDEVSISFGQIHDFKKGEAFTFSQTTNIVPGDEITMTTPATVSYAADIATYVCVKIVLDSADLTEEAEAKVTITEAAMTGWTETSEKSGVWYKAVAVNGEKSASISDVELEVDDDLTLEDVYGAGNGAAKAGANGAVTITLSFQFAVIQQDNIDVTTDIPALFAEIPADD